MFFDTAGLTSVQVIGISPLTGGTSRANASALRCNCPTRHDAGQTLVIRTVRLAPPAARTSTYAPHAWEPSKSTAFIAAVSGSGLGSYEQAPPPLES